MATTSPLSVTVRLQNALNQPLLQLRCEEVGRILNESTSKDASYILRTVVENIFGVNGQLGWGLRNITRSGMMREFDQLRAFLGVAGPLLSLTYRLAHDPFLMFEFPVVWLPAKSRAEIEEGTPGIFYINKVQNPGPGKTPTNILLNAFEFYFFHFTHFLVSSSNQRWSLSWSTAGDAMYPCLLEDYLCIFLPCDNSVPPGPPSPPVAPRGVLSPVATRSPGGPNPNFFLTTFVSPIAPRNIRTPIPHGFTSSDGGVIHASSPLHAVHNPHPQLNIWTSQVLVQILVEMWVNQCLATRSPSRSLAPSPSTPHSPQYTALHACSVLSEHIPLEYRPNWHTNGFEVFVPSSDHVRVVRMLIKHLHFFTNSIKSAQPSPLDDLRKNLWSMYRKSLYQFLLHTFKHWPLDSSFRLVLETWLSYIQPWRYTDFSPVNITLSQVNCETENQRTVEAKWQGFIAENLLFYTLLFYHLMTRLFRLDLCAPKNAQILFRATKVFSQTNLGNFIREIEEALEDPHFMHRSLLGAHRGLPGLHGDQFPARSLASVARAHIVEMAGPSDVYNAMFSSGNLTMVESLLKSIRRAYEAMVKEQQQHMAATAANNGSDVKNKDSWWSRVLKGLFEPTAPTEDDNSAEDIRKTVIHLDTAQRQLSAIFNLHLPLDCSQIIDSFDAGYHGMRTMHLHHSYESSLSSGDKSIPDQIDTPVGPQLTSYGRYQLISGQIRRRDFKYEGDPDLRPICTYEIAFLVRWLYALATFINTKYHTQMDKMYSRSDVLGSLAKMILMPPETVYERTPGSRNSRTLKFLPARLSLRFQASKHVIGYELALSLVIYILGLWGFVLKSFLMLAVVGSVSYLLHRYLTRSHSQLHQE